MRKSEADVGCLKEIAVPNQEIAELLSGLTLRFENEEIEDGYISAINGYKLNEDGTCTVYTNEYFINHIANPEGDNYVLEYSKPLSVTTEDLGLLNVDFSKAFSTDNALRIGGKDANNADGC